MRPIKLALTVKNHLVIYTMAIVIGLATISVSPLGADTKTLSIITTWENTGNPEEKILELLAQDLEKELKIPTKLVNISAIGGLLATNQVASAKSNGSIISFLPLNPVMTREIQYLTPYSIKELKPLLMAWNQPWALVARHSAPFDNLTELAKEAKKRPVVLAHTGFEPISTETILAIAIARSMDFNFSYSLRNSLSPALLYQNNDDMIMDSNIDVVVWPLSPNLETTMEYGEKIKIIAILSDFYEGPCAPSGKDLSAQNLKAIIHDWHGFYLPAQTTSLHIDQFSKAIWHSLKSQKILSLLEENCLSLLPESQNLNDDFDTEYQNQLALLLSLGRAPDPNNLDK